MKLHKDVVSCKIGEKVSSVAKMIRDKSVRHVYITDKEKLVGVFSVTDILSSVAYNKDLNREKLINVMNKVAFVKKDQGPEYAYALMRKFNTMVCPVVDEKEHLIGYYKFAEVCEALNKKVEEFKDGTN